MNIHEYQVDEDQFQTFLDDFCGGLWNEDLTRTSDTLDNFTEKWGQPHEVETDGIYTHYLWNDLQTRPGKTRGDLNVVVIDGVDGCFSRFWGEV